MNKILFISPDTFRYYKMISAAISHKGLTPIWLNQLPSTSIASRGFFRLAPRIARQLATGHFTRELDKLDQVDQILIIKGEGVSADTIIHMRARFPNARIVFYLWDSLANTPGADQKIALCDAAFSFDPVDCDRTRNLTHLPLFHSKDMESTRTRPGFAAFIGTLHSNRYELIKRLANEIEKVTNVKPFLYFYYPNRWLFALLKLFKKQGLQNVRASDVHFVPVPRDKYERLNSEVEIVLDICHPRQSGLTMRSIESLGEGKKLITNNKTIRRYDFFRPENCYVVDGEICEGFINFLNGSYLPLPPEIVMKYHIGSWLDTLLTAPARASVHHLTQDSQG